MTREEAIKQIESLFEHCEAMMTSDEPVWSQDCEALKVALFALRGPTREQVEMMRATLEPTTLPDGTKTVATKCSECGAHNLITHLFCWRCGSPLTDVAVDILVRRLEEALKDD